MTATEVRLRTFTHGGMIAHYRGRNKSGELFLKLVLAGTIRDVRFVQTRRPR